MEMALIISLSTFWLREHFYEVEFSFFFFFLVNAYNLQFTPNLFSLPKPSSYHQTMSTQIPEAL